eukprot:tig00001001_g6205.t1
MGACAGKDLVGGSTVAAAAGEPGPLRRSSEHDADSHDVGGISGGVQLNSGRWRAPEAKGPMHGPPQQAGTLPAVSVHPREVQLKESRQVVSPAAAGSPTASTAGSSAAPAAAEALRALVDKQLEDRWNSIRTARAKGAWIHLRVFLSSTFKDFAGERDQLTRVVFPALNESLRPRRISLVPVDLRWGLTEEATTSGPGALHLCLEEVERCRPYVLALLGDRFGWVPDAYRVDTGTAPQLAWVSSWPRGHSITSLELEYGVMASRSPLLRAFAFLRELTGGAPPENFSAESPEAARRMADLRARVAASPGCRAVRYEIKATSSRWSLFDSGPALKGLDEFASAALSLLRESLDADFPPPARALTRTLSADGKADVEEEAGADDPAASESAVQELFLDEVIEAAAAAAEAGGAGGPTPPPSREGARPRLAIPGREALLQARRSLHDHAAARDEQNVLLVSAEPGQGKTTLLAFLVREERAARGGAGPAGPGGPAPAVFAHFCGASVAAASPPLLLRRAAAAAAKGGALLVIDDVGALAGDSAARPSTGALDPAPSAAPPQADGDAPTVRVVLSAIAPKEGRSGREELVDRAVRLRFRERLRSVALAGLDAASQRALVAASLLRYGKLRLRRYGKALSSGQMAALLGRPHGGRPLWLATACTELRLYGSFEGLDARVAALPGCSDGPGGGYRGGLPEDDLIQLLKTTRAGWARLMWSAGHYVRLGSGSASEAPRLRLFHGAFAAAVRNRYGLPPPLSPADVASGSLAAGYHARLADHFLGQADPAGDGSFSSGAARPRALVDGPWHALAAGGPRAARARAALASFAFLCAAGAAAPPLFAAAGDLVAAARAGASPAEDGPLSAAGAFLRKHGSALTDDPSFLRQLALNSKRAPYPPAEALALARGGGSAVLERVAGPPLPFAVALPEPLHALVGSEQPIAAFALSPDGRLLASAAEMLAKPGPGQRALEPIRLWDAPGNRLLGLLEGHAQPPAGHKPRFHGQLDFGAVALSFSPDSRLHLEA